MERGKLDSKELINLCRKMRLHALDMALAAGRRGAHLSGSLSCIEIYAVLYGSILKYNVYFLSISRFKKYIQLSQSC